MQLNTLCSHKSTPCLTFPHYWSVNSSFMGSKERTADAIPFKPLLDLWLKSGSSKAELARKLGVEQAVITNWIARKGIPLAKLGVMAKLVGFSSGDAYLMSIGRLEPSPTEQEAGAPAKYQVLDDDLKKVIDAWNFLKPEERIDFRDQIVSAGGYNAMMRGEYGKDPDHATDERVKSAYRLPESIDPTTPQKQSKTKGNKK